MAPEHNYAVEMVNEPDYSFGSTRNVRHYATEVSLNDDRYIPSSIHGILVNDIPVIVVGSDGGATSIHPHSMLRLGEILYFAVGPNVCRLTLGNQKLDWHLKTDWATCFGIYYNERYDTLISHGEMEISRFNTDGRILWKAGGADIFTEGISLSDNCVEATDFNHCVYYFDYGTGQEMRQP